MLSRRAVLTGTLAGAAALAVNTTEGAAMAVEGPKLAVIGDSTVGRAPEAYRRAAEHVAEYNPENVYVNGLGGRPLISKAGFNGESTITAIRKAKAQLGGIGDWVISLGINSFWQSDLGFEADVYSVLQEIGPATVWWYDTRQQRPGNAHSIRTTKILRSIMSGQPHAELLEWNEFLQSGMDDPAWWLGDADVTHNSALGFKLRATFGMGAVS